MPARRRAGAVTLALALSLAACDRGLPSPTPLQGGGEAELPAAEPVEPGAPLESGEPVDWAPVLQGEPAEPPAGTPAGFEGRWRAAYEEIEIFGTGRLLLRRGSSRALGRYEWVEGNRILISYEGLLAGALPGDYRVRMRGDSLALCETDAPARCIRFRRWRPEDGPTPGSRPDEGPPRLALPPRSDQIPPEARMKEAEVTLRHAYVMQRSFHAERGEYARTMEELRSIGWEPQPLRYFNPPRLVREGTRFCIVAEPRSPDLWPLYVDQTGEIRQGRECP